MPILILADHDEYPMQRTKMIGRIKLQCGILPILEKIEEYYSSSSIEVRLVISSNERCPKPERIKYQQLSKNFKFISRVNFRSNYFMDIGSYNYGYQQCLEERYTGDILFMNSSVTGPHSKHWLSTYLQLFNSDEKIGLTGTAANIIPNGIIFNQKYNSNLEHLHSWFLLSNMVVLRNCFGESLIKEKHVINKKEHVITNGEIAISQRILNSGYGINCMAFPNSSFFKGGNWPYPFKLGWRSKKDLKQFVNTTIV